jgi:hypothetical protein
MAQINGTALLGGVSTLVTAARKYDELELFIKFPTINSKKINQVKLSSFLLIPGMPQSESTLTVS